MPPLQSCVQTLRSSLEEIILTNTTIDDEYEKLQRIDAKVSSEEASFRTARRKSNIKKNRFSNVLANEDSRVIIQANTYINANLIEFPRQLKKYSYIMSQHPLKNTINDFWDMVVEHEVSIIVQLNSCTEENYIVSSYYSDLESKYDLHSEHLPEISESFLSCTKLTLRTKKNLSTYSLYHLHYLSWPDHGVPRFPSSIIFTIEVLNETLNRSHHHPKTLVHCMAGVGRTGTFIAIHFAVSILTEKFDFHRGIFSFFEIVKFLKTKRSFSVQNKNQYKYCYTVLAKFLRNDFTRRKGEMMPERGSVSI